MAITLTNLGIIRSKLERLRGSYRAAKGQLHKERIEYRQSRQIQRDLLEVQQIIQGIAREIQQNVHARVSEVVTRSLQAVWGNRYAFEILFSEKRGKTEARLIFRRRDGLELDPLEESSGGVVDVAAFALRLACIVMSQPQRRRLVILDEPFKNVRGAQYQERVREMVERIAAELDFQIVLNTDLELLQTGRIINLAQGSSQ